MRQGIIFRTHTEEKNKTAIVQLWHANSRASPTLGYYRNKSEKSIVIEIVGGSANQIKRPGERIRKMNGQKSVLILKLAKSTAHNILVLVPLRSRLAPLLHPGTNTSRSQLRNRILKVLPSVLLRRLEGTPTHLLHVHSNNRLDGNERWPHA